VVWFALCPPDPERARSANRFPAALSDRPREGSFGQPLPCDSVRPTPRGLVRPTAGVDRQWTIRELL